jgi:hypothetical protein
VPGDESTALFSRAAIRRALCQLLLEKRLCEEMSAVAG